MPEDVVGGTAPLPTGDGGSAPDVASQQPTETPQAQPQATEPRLIPETDLRNLQSTYDKRFRDMELRAQEQERSWQSKQREIEGRAWIADRAAELIPDYIEGYKYSPAQAREAALIWARKEYAEQSEIQQLQERAQVGDRVTQQEQERQQRIQQLSALATRLETRFGLSTQELREASSDLTGREEDFEDQLLERAIAARDAKKAGQSYQEATRLRSEVPTLPGSAPASSELFTGLPPGMRAGTKEATEYLERINPRNKRR